MAQASPSGRAAKTGCSTSCRAASASAPRPTEHTVIPSWAVASIEPICSRAARQVAARALPAAANGSSAERRAAIAANSAPTKNALARRSPREIQSAIE